MLYDKLRWLKFDGHFFALLGVANLVGYGLSYIMKPDNYIYFFGYTGRESRITQPFKAMMASDNYKNVGWTAPILIYLNFLLHK